MNLNKILKMDRYEVLININSYRLNVNNEIKNIIIALGTGIAEQYRRSYEAYRNSPGYAGRAGIDVRPLRDTDRVLHLVPERGVDHSSGDRTVIANDLSVFRR